MNLLEDAGVISLPVASVLIQGSNLSFKAPGSIRSISFATAFECNNL